jgi:pSer/pThr/pTyr-binding forkhead associated (FHA) protein
LFNQKGSGPVDVKTIRQQVLLFIKEQLRKSEGGEGQSIRGLRLFVAEQPERHLYEAALYQNEQQLFRDEVQRIADDFAIDLPADWTLETIYVEELPAEAVRHTQLPVAITAITRSNTPLKIQDKAVIRILNGQAEQEVYPITASSGRICIGRDRKTQSPDGFMRENTIAFPSDSPNDSNRYISRSHAHIEWDKEEGNFFLYADEGGIPPRNKVKVQRADGESIRLQTVEIGHRLETGDQIILGGAVLLAFDYQTDEAK